ncbi:hypothetical protein ACTT2I_10555 [Stenotrophomonas sp. PUT21]|uniref:hypothetical protein n=1 Tax=Stenotrophomonas sp. PUT21 TaxID=3456954 RepID=UPI003FCC4795
MHKDAVALAFGFDMAVTNHPVAGKAAQKSSGRHLLLMLAWVVRLEIPTPKKLAPQGFLRMKSAMLDERDPDSEVRGWMRRLGEMLI